jgi:drug/metabolite transporter (DMT)-like permease
VRTAGRRRTLWRWAGLVLLVVGVVLVALPDTNDRIFSLSPQHGPAAVDLLGAVLLCAGWALLLATTAGPWRRVRAVFATGAGAAIAAVAGLGVGLVVASVLHQFEQWWLVGAVAASVAQLALVWRSREPGP